jgi:energy-coupling factor transporter ATP-binding protein EcfA2
MTAPRLVARDLACRRGDRVLFRGVQLDLGPGEALHLAGANGIGKSSLIRILAGLMRPFAGTVERDGAIALVDERLALDGHLPLGRALAFWHAIDRTAPGADDPLAWPIWPMCRCAISPPGRRSARRWPGWRQRRRRSGCSTSRSTGWTPRGRGRRKGQSRRIVPPAGWW